MDTETFKCLQKTIVNEDDQLMKYSENCDQHDADDVMVMLVMRMMQMVRASVFVIDVEDEI